MTKQKYPLNFTDACLIMYAQDKGQIISKYAEDERHGPRSTYYFDCNDCLVDQTGNYAILDIQEIKSKWRIIYEEEQ
jgi:hypothetical protein